MSRADDRRQQVINQELAKKAKDGKPQRQAAINAMCASCIFDPDGGGGSWRQQVEACTSTGCPLFELRPAADYRARG